MKYRPRSCSCRISDGSDFEWTLVDHLHSWKDDLLDWANEIVSRPLLRRALRNPRIREDPDRLLKVVNRLTYDSFASLDQTERYGLVDVVAAAKRAKWRAELTEWAEVIQHELKHGRSAAAGLARVCLPRRSESSESAVISEGRCDRLDLRASK
jgi:hypothetical protein